MRDYFKIILAAASLLMLSGCASHENFVKHYDSWVGKNIHYFREKFGYPDMAYRLSNGHEVYVYERSRIYSTPTFTPTFGYYGYGGYYGGMSVAYNNNIEYRTCKLFLEIDKRGTIVRWGSRGNNCRM